MRFEHEHLAFDAAQIGQRIARGEAAAIERPVGGGAWSRSRRRSERATFGMAESRRVSSAIAARGSRCASSGEEQRPVETAGEVGLERGDGIALDRLVRGGAAGKTRQLGLVARRRDDEAALAAGDLHGLRPVGQRLLAEADDERLGALALTPRCEHAAGIERAAGARAPRGARSARPRRRGGRARKPR